MNNLRQISAGIDQWALENNKIDTDAVTQADIGGYLRAWPICPAGGNYPLATVVADPTCTAYDPVTHDATLP
jgi:hypothetical protein